MTCLTRAALAATAILCVQAQAATAPEVTSVNAIDLTGSEVMMFAQQMSDTDLTCKVKQYGRIDKTGPLHVGDKVLRDGMTIPVGIIEKNTFTSDVEYNGKTVVHKGDTLCLVGENAGALPHEGDCKALWLRVNPCKVME